jgi:type II secretory pathway pseudopilin PulG
MGIKQACVEERGFSYLGVLFAIAITGVALLAVSEVWTKVAERQKLAQLDWVGQQYVQAIESYYYANTGSVHFYPTKLDDLLEDKRYLSVKRHLRTLYPDPYTGALSWKPMTSSTGGIQGVAFDHDGDPPVHKQFVFVPASNPQVR